MFRTIADFTTVWTDEADFTRRIFGALTDDSLQQSISNDHRTIGRLAWHITQTIPEMLGKSGLPATGPGEHDAVPASAKAVADAYDAAAKSVIPAMTAAGWTDATLDEKRDMYGEQWVVSFALRAFVMHQVHHRAQITVLMRQAGLKVPGIYGPAKEDWATWGMPAPEV